MSGRYEVAINHPRRWHGVDEQQPIVLKQWL